ncbi:MAG: hypothetical protein QME12_06400 [Nanoarchaeota archaeon]|nr:hypothetical protein [Nanoarchaeota archaeon]
MEETTSRTLVVIMVATLFIALFGTVATMNKFGGFRALTGAWSESTTTTLGAVNITINTNLVINFSDDSANFGTGYICGGEVCSQTVIGTDGTNDTCNCGWSIPNGLILENIGNRRAIIKISNTNYTSSLLYDSAGASGYAWKFENTSSGTCSGGNFTAGTAPWGAYTNITAVYSASVNWTICNLFNYTAGNDKLNLSFKFHITPTTRATEVGLSDTWTVSAVDGGQ